MRQYFEVSHSLGCELSHTLLNNSNNLHFTWSGVLCLAAFFVLITFDLNVLFTEIFFPHRAKSFLQKCSGAIFTNSPSLKNFSSRNKGSLENVDALELLHQPKKLPLGCGVDMWKSGPRIISVTKILSTSDVRLCAWLPWLDKLMRWLSSISFADGNRNYI